MAHPTRRGKTLGSTLPAVLTTAVVLGLGAPPPADAGEWTLSLQPLYLTISGHDPHVLTVHEIDRDAAPAQSEKRAVLLESENGPGEVLFYRRLEDTDVALWTADLRATWTLAEDTNGSVGLTLGLRVGDFDNDYRAVVGVEGVGGRRLDASSNYGRMTGPLVGLTGAVRWGKNTLEGHLAQSALFGEVELTGRARELAGPPAEVEEDFAFTEVQVFRADQDVTIPITEARIRWTYQATEHLALGAGVDTAAWWDVPVPPGTAPTDDGLDTLHENTLVLTGALAIVECRF